MPDQFEHLKAALADRYTIERPIGAGGMATVYLAHDVKHDRKVAVKVMRSEIAASLGSDRFLREIRLAAKLQHPHILMLIESGEADGILYYVMPFVDGESLATRMEREKQLPVEDSVSIALEVAGALSYAHEQNVIHRDIKPDNILLSGGHAVVMDFGIGRAISAAGGDKLTETGLVVGTPAYMSPEQATGSGDLDGRTDVYALGCVLYEMLSGEPPYTGVTPQSILAKSLTDPVPSARRLRETISPVLDAAVRMALAKLPADRFASAKAFAEALVADTPVTPTVETPMPFPSPVRWGRRFAYVGASAAALVLAWALFGRGGDSSPSDMTGSTTRRLTSFVGWENSPSWSPDGSQITYSHVVGGDADVATLSLGGGDPHILTGDSPADEWNPRWSPDGSKIAFVSDRGAGNNIYWIPPTGGAERKVAETNIPFLEQMFTWDGSLGATPWSPDGQELVFSRLHEGGDVALWKVNLSTGQETQLTTPPSGAEDTYASWSFDGEQIAFSRFEKGIPTVWLLPTEGGEPSLFIGDGGADMQPAWFPDNERLAFLSFRGGALDVWQIELGTGELSQLTSGGAGMRLRPAVAPNGSVAYVDFDHQVDIYWISLDTPDLEQNRLTSFTNENFGPRVSRDGNRVVYHANRTGNDELWLYDRTTDQHRLLTEDPAPDRMADWSPDGEEIVFLSARGGAVRLWVVETATGVARQLTDHELPWAYHQGDTQAGPRWSPDGSVIGYLAPVEQGTAIWLLEPDGSNPHPSTVSDAFSFGWYRDGQRVVYTRRAPDGSGAVELRAAHLGTGEDVLLRAGAISEVSVSPDGSALTFIASVSHFTMELQLLRLAPPTAPSELPTAVGEPRQITFGNGEWHVHGGGWAWDGSGLVYSRDADRGDIYLIEPIRQR